MACHYERYECARNAGEALGKRTCCSTKLSVKGKESSIRIESLSSRKMGGSPPPHRACEGREKDALAFLRIRVLNKTSLGDARLIPAPSSSPCPVTPLFSTDLPHPASRREGPVVSTSDMYTSRAHNLVSVVPHSRPSYVVLVVVVIFLVVRLAAIASSFRAGDREANRKGVHHCRRLRPGRQQNAVLLADEKNPTRTRERRREERKGNAKENSLRSGKKRREGRWSREMCLAFRDLVPPGVYTSINASTRAHRRESNIATSASRKSFNLLLEIINEINMPTRLINNKRFYAIRNLNFFAFF